MTFTGFTGSNLPALRDDFNRADNILLGAPWREADAVSGNGLQILSNQVAGIAGLNSAYYAGISDNHIGFAFTIATMSAVDYDVAGGLVAAGSGTNPVEFT